MGWPLVLSGTRGAGALRRRERVKEAAALVVAAGDPRAPRLLVITRSLRLAAMGGYTAFPGGVVEPGDAEVPVHGAPGERHAPLVAALRETFEELGLLAVPGHAIDRERLDDARQRLTAGAASFAAILAQLGIALEAAPYRAVGRWQTPPFSPRRFDTTFHAVTLAEAPALEAPSSEVAEAGWYAPHTLLADWRQGRRILVPPVRHLIESHRDGTAGLVERALAHPSAGGTPVEVIEAHAGVRLIPLVSRTLPPFAHTNTYVLGDRELVVVDPAGATEDARAILDRHLEQLVAEGRRLVATLLTHQHPDHVGGVAHLCERWRLPVWTHALSASRLTVPVARTLAEGEVVTLAGESPQRWRALHLPGHAVGHLCFMEETSRSVISGDNVLGAGTTVIDPPEGDMAVYLDSLARLRALDPGVIFPGHGPPVADGAGKIDALIRHRAQREAKVVAALARFPGGASLDQLLPAVYDDVDPALHPLARRSLEAHLIKLVAERRATASNAKTYALTRHEP